MIDALLALVIGPIILLVKDYSAGLARLDAALLKATIAPSVMRCVINE